MHGFVDDHVSGRMALICSGESQQILSAYSVRLRGLEALLQSNPRVVFIFCTYCKTAVCLCVLINLYTASSVVDSWLASLPNSESHCESPWLLTIRIIQNIQNIIGFFKFILFKIYKWCTRTNKSGIVNSSQPLKDFIVWIPEDHSKHSMTWFIFFFKIKTVSSQPQRCSARGHRHSNLWNFETEWFQVFKIIMCLLLCTMYVHCHPNKLVKTSSH